MRPFRFLGTVDGYPGFAELTSLAGKAEAVGCSTFVLPDHLIGQYAAMPLLAVVAAATERLRVGTFVLNACLRHPAVLAQALATLDVPSGGRLKIALAPASNNPRRAAAGDRCGRVELNTPPAGGPTVVTGDPRAAARRRADRIREQTGAELTVEEILDSPHVFIGSIKDLTRKFADLRERFGISSFLIDDLDALAPVVEELAGQCAHRRRPLPAAAARPHQ